MILLNPNICAHIADTQNNFFSEFIKGIFCMSCAAGLGEANHCTTCENPTLTDLAVLCIYQRQ